MNMFDFGLEAIVYASNNTAGNGGRRRGCGYFTIATALNSRMKRSRAHTMSRTSPTLSVLLRGSAGPSYSYRLYYHSSALQQLCWLRNLPTRLFFAFALPITSCQLAAEQRAMARCMCMATSDFQVVFPTVYSFFINLSPGLTVEDVTIVGPANCD
ncbi:hypothetical protein O9993_01280 [Vibrio lentus]|nr:hypothetical protein [Vibrio lentus]